MPSHQERRDPLPEGYQFGDGGSAVAMRALDDSDGSRVIARTSGNWQMGTRKDAPTDRSKCPKCHADAYITPGGMWHCDSCAIGWEQA